LMKTGPNTAIVSEIFRGLLGSIAKADPSKAIVAGDRILSVDGITDADGIVRQLYTWAANPMTDLTIVVAPGQVAMAPVNPETSGYSKTEFAGGVFLYTPTAMIYMMSILHSMSPRVMFIAAVALAFFMVMSRMVQFDVFPHQQQVLHELVIQNLIEPPTEVSLLALENPVHVGGVDCQSFLNTVLASCENASNTDNSDPDTDNSDPDTDNSEPDWSVLSCQNKGESGNFNCVNEWTSTEAPLNVGAKIDGQEAFKMMTVEVSHCPMTKGGNSDMCVVYHRA